MPELSEMSEFCRVLSGLSVNNTKKPTTLVGLGCGMRVVTSCRGFEGNAMKVCWVKYQYGYPWWGVYRMDQGIKNR